MKIIVIACLFALMFGRVARAEHFNIDLTVESGKEKAEGHADTYPPAAGNNPRQVLRASREAPLIIQFFFKSNFPHDPIKNVTVRYFVALVTKPGEVPNPSKTDTVSGSFVMDFKPKGEQTPGGKVGLRQQFRLQRAGTYLVRVESENTDTDHEHFAALDLIIE